MIRNLLISLLVIGLIGITGCAHQNTTVISDQQSLVINDSQFQCGPNPGPWPDDKTLQSWEAKNIIDQANSYWNWGNRCSKQLEYNRLYFQCFKKIQSSCEELDKLKSP